MTYYVRDSWGEIDYVSEEDLPTTIVRAWNYEASVYDEENYTLFNGYLDNEENSELLEPFDLQIINIKGYRYLQHKKTGVIYLAGWEPPLEEGYQVKNIK